MLVALGWAVIRRFLGGIRWVLIALYNHKSYSWPDVADHLRVYFLSNLANYIPGSLWYMASRIQLSRKKGVSTLQTSMGLIYETWLLVWSGCMVGLYVAVIVFPQNRLNIFIFTSFMLILSLVTIHPKIINLILAHTLRFLKRPPMLLEVTFSWGLQLWLVSLAVWIAGGLSLFYLLKAFSPDLSLDNFVYVTSASALAWTIGFLTPWAPSGLGVRDGILVWLLEVVVAAPLAVAATVGARLMTVIEDLLWAAIVLFLWRK
ncbi:MAG: hypothetical protein H6632_02135 [Anaerolineales bacterium]|nr:hypothetical protein [Anaerolineales bacterium]